MGKDNCKKSSSRDELTSCLLSGWGTTTKIIDTRKLGCWDPAPGHHSLLPVLSLWLPRCLSRPILALSRNFLGRLIHLTPKLCHQHSVQSVQMRIVFRLTLSKPKVLILAYSGTLLPHLTFSFPPHLLWHQLLPFAQFPEHARHTFLRPLAWDHLSPAISLAPSLSSFRSLLRVPW